MKRSQITQRPASSAGRMVVRTWSSRAAANRIASVSAPSGFANPDRITWRMISAPGDPPGSRVSRTSIPTACSRSASRAAWVDLPEPSPPSNVMNLPRIRSPADRSRPAAIEDRRRPLYPLGTRAEQGDDHFGHSVESALGQRPFADVVGSLERLRQNEAVAAPHFDGADLLALLHRCRNWPGIDDAGDQSVAASLRHHNADLAIRDQSNFAVSAAVNLGASDRRPGGEQDVLLEAAETPFQKLLSIVAALLCILRAVHDHDQPQPVLHGRADQTVAGLLREPCLQSVRADAH